LKNYSTADGQTYRYFYEGQRPYRSGAEFVFQVSAESAPARALSVFFSDRAAGTWERMHDRLLTGTERYAVAKLALFQAFEAGANDARVSAKDVAGFAERLGLD